MSRELEDLTCWFNGKWVPLREVRVSILDLGFIHCDATYDVLRSQSGKLMHFELHQKRFEESCKYFGFNPIANLQEVALELLEVNGIEEAFVWMCVWRGDPPSGNPRDLSAPQKSVVYVKPYYGLKKSSNEFRLSIEPEFRRVPDQCYSQKSKNFAWIEMNLAHRRSVQKGYDSALLLSLDDFVSEGPGFAVCFIKEGQVITPKKDCLGSITIQVVEKLCKTHGLDFLRKDISVEEALAADEAFACSTSGGVTPITQIDEKSFPTQQGLHLQKLFSQM